MATQLIISLMVCVLISTIHGMVISEECDGKVLCPIKPRDYPEEIIQKHIKTNNLSKRRREMTMPTNRYDDDNCNTRITAERIFTAKHENVTKFVVQHQGTFEQWVTQTECLKRSITDDRGNTIKTRECLQNYISKDYSSKCVPVFSTIKLYLYNPIKDSFEHADFPFPVCCSCNISY